MGPRIELVSIKGRATERNDTWWRWAWVMEVRNLSAETVAFNVNVKWVDKDGFPIDRSAESGLTIGPNSAKTFNGDDLVRVPGAAGVKAVKAELTER